MKNKGNIVIHDIKIINPPTADRLARDLRAALKKPVPQKCPACGAEAFQPSPRSMVICGSRAVGGKPVCVVQARSVEEWNKIPPSPPSPVNGVWKDVDEEELFFNSSSLTQSSRVAESWCGGYTCTEYDGLVVLRSRRVATKKQALAWVGAGHWPGEKPIAATENVDGIWYNHHGDMFSIEDFEERVSPRSSAFFLSSICCYKWHAPNGCVEKEFDHATDEQAALWVGRGKWPVDT
jgi:hypothetical protein